VSSEIIRNIVGQTKSAIDLRSIMDNKKIFLINLSKGRIGEDSSALLGAMIITKLQLAAMSRVDVPEEERVDFYLYVDEFQNFATESFANILSEARKYRLNLIVAHQYIGQLIHDRDTIVRDAIFGNVGTIITFRVGADDAEFLEKEFEPTYLINDLVNLTKFHIYLKLMINGMSSSPFSAISLPPIGDPTGNESKVIGVSRERYATNKAEVETKINKWMGVEFHTEAAQSESSSVEQEETKETLRFQDRPKEKPKTFNQEVENREPENREPSRHGREKDQRGRKKEKHRRRDNQRRHDKPHDKPKENPVWQTVKKLADEKINTQAQKARGAIETLDGSLEKTLNVKPGNTDQSQSEKALKPGDKIKF